MSTSDKYFSEAEYQAEQSSLNRLEKRTNALKEKLTARLEASGVYVGLENISLSDLEKLEEDMADGEVVLSVVEEAEEVNVSQWEGDGDDDELEDGDKNHDIRNTYSKVENYGGIPGLTIEFWTGRFTLLYEPDDRGQWNGVKIQIHYETNTEFNNPRWVQVYEGGDGKFKYDNIWSNESTSFYTNEDMKSNSANGIFYFMDCPGVTEKSSSGFEPFLIFCDGTKPIFSIHYGYNDYNTKFTYPTCFKVNRFFPYLTIPYKH